MIDLKKYGYKSGTEFWNDRNVPAATFEEMANDASWHIAKRVLFHKDCPLHIRDRFRGDTKWYKRITATLTKAAPRNYHWHAGQDPHPFVQRAHRNYGWHHRRAILRLLEKLGIKNAHS